VDVPSFQVRRTRKFAFIRSLRVQACVPQAEVPDVLGTSWSAEVLVVSGFVVNAVDQLAPAFQDSSTRTRQFVEVPLPVRKTSLRRTRMPSMATGGELAMVESNPKVPHCCAAPLVEVLA
jgi:hypothetical protein